MRFTVVQGSLEAVFRLIFTANTQSVLGTTVLSYAVREQPDQAYTLEKYTLYFKKESEFFTYQVLSPNGEMVTGVLSVQDYPFLKPWFNEVNLSICQLELVLPSILKATEAKGHTERVKPDAEAEFYKQIDLDSARQCYFTNTESDLQLLRGLLDVLPGQVSRYTQGISDGRLFVRLIGGLNLPWRQLFLQSNPEDHSVSVREQETQINFRGVAYLARSAEGLPDDASALPRTSLPEPAGLSFFYRNGQPDLFMMFVIRRSTSVSERELSVVMPRSCIPDDINFQDHPALQVVDYDTFSAIDWSPLIANPALEGVIHLLFPEGVCCEPRVRFFGDETNSILYPFPDDAPFAICCASDIISSFLGNIDVTSTRLYCQQVERALGCLETQVFLEKVKNFQLSLASLKSALPQALFSILEQLIGHCQQVGNSELSYDQRRRALANLSLQYVYCSDVCLWSFVHPILKLYCFLTPQDVNTLSTTAEDDLLSYTSRFVHDRLLSAILKTHKDIERTLLTISLDNLQHVLSRGKVPKEFSKLSCLALDAISQKRYHELDETHQGIVRRHLKTVILTGLRTDMVKLMLKPIISTVRAGYSLKAIANIEDYVCGFFMEIFHERSRGFSSPGSGDFLDTLLAIICEDLPRKVECSILALPLEELKSVLQLIGLLAYLKEELPSVTQWQFDERASGELPVLKPNTIRYPSPPLLLSETMLEHVKTVLTTAELNSQVEALSQKISRFYQLMPDNRLPSAFLGYFQQASSEDLLPTLLGLIQKSNTQLSKEHVLQILKAGLDTQGLSISVESFLRSHLRNPREGIELFLQAQRARSALVMLITQYPNWRAMTNNIDYPVEVQRCIAQLLGLLRAALGAEERPEADGRISLCPVPEQHGPASRSGSVDAATANPQAFFPGSVSAATPCSRRGSVNAWVVVTAEPSEVTRPRSQSTS